ncbi:MAG: T9SS type A sorting domain-containing protein [Melioribacteraceae bacterium]|nr:MAG: T9SS type A sorting domain-containing protein [Melioribacteraceae bacterium]
MKIVYMIFMFLCLTIAQPQETIEWPSLADSPWPTFRGDAQATGRSQYVGPKTPNLIWEADLPLGILWGPTIGYNEKLYFGTHAFLLSDTSESNLVYSYNSDGTINWSFETGDWINNETKPIAAHNGTVYFTTGLGELLAMTQSGDLKWRTPVMSIFYISISKDGEVYGSIGDTLVAYNYLGEQILQKDIGEVIVSPVTFSTDGESLFFHTGAMYKPNSTNYIYSTDKEGNLNWRMGFSNSNYGEIAIDNSDNLYFYASIPGSPSPQYLYSLNKSGSINWKFQVYVYNSYSAPTILFNGDIVFFTRLIDRNLIISLNQNGETNWEYELDPDEDVFFADINHPLVSDAEGNIYLGSTDGNNFYALDREGNLLWKYDLEGREFDSSPAIGSDGTLYLGLNGSSFDRSQTRTLIAIKDDPNSVRDEETPTEFALYQNYPNPFNPSTRIKYQVANTAKVNLIVYDILGREIATLVNEIKPVGTHEVEFDASELPSGIFFYRLQSGDFTQTKKMMVIK